MTDIHSDSAREFRRARLLEVKPLATPVMMTEAAFRERYKNFHVVPRDYRAEVEAGEHLMFCPACVEAVDDASDKLRVLHVTYGDDPLGNFPLIATVKCHGCGWEEMIPVVKPELSFDQQVMVRRYRAAAKKNMAFSAPGVNPPKVWDEISLTPRPEVRFGQAKADAVWRDMVQYEADRRDFETASQQLDIIAEIEAQQAKEAQMRNNAKAANYAQAYGMGAQNMQNAFGGELMKQYEAELMRRVMMNTPMADLARSQKEAAEEAHKRLRSSILKTPW